MNKQLIDKIIEYKDKTFLISGHINPDYDSIGSSFGLAIGLQKLGYKAFVLLEEVHFDMLNQINKQEHFNIVADINNLPQDYVFFGVDSSSPDRFDIFEPVYQKAKYRLIIDHHPHNLLEADAKYVDTKAGAAAELVYEVLKKLGLKIDTEIADFLYTAIINDTLLFSVALRPKTLQIATNLLKTGVDYKYFIKSTCNNNSIFDMKILLELINKIQFDEIHFIVVNEKIQNNVDYADYIQKFAGTISNLNDIERIAFLTVREQTIKVSFRGKAYNIDKLSQIFGGGGHRNACGFTYNSSDVEMCKEEIKDFIRKYCE